jgi:hypothetical protein
VIPSGVDADYYTPGPARDGRGFRALFVGRFHRRRT